MSFFSGLLHRLSTAPGVMTRFAPLDRGDPRLTHHRCAMWHVPHGRNKWLHRSLYVLQLLLWYTIYVWRDLYRGMRYLRRRRDAGKWSVTQHHYRRLRSALWRYAIPTQSIILYRLLDTPEDRWLDHVYQHETHKWQSMLSGVITPEERQMISDKGAFAHICAQHGIQSIQTIATIPKGSTSEVLHDIVLREQSVFVKPPDANRSTDCYELHYDADGYTMRELNRAELYSGEGAILAQLRCASERHDLLLQPLLHNVTEWEDLSESSELITMRIISEWCDGQCMILAAELQIPITDGGKYYDIIPIAPSTGQIHDELIVSPFEIHDRQQALLPRIGHTTVPHWTELVDSIGRAHALCPHMRLIGWDAAITTQGPILIEGNSGWGTHSLTRNELAAKKYWEIELGATHTL